MCCRFICYKETFTLHIHYLKNDWKHWPIVKIVADRYSADEFSDQQVDSAIIISDVKVKYNILP